MKQILGDLHAHLGFGIDDGPASLSEARTLINMAGASGTSHIWVTPHVIDPVSAPSWEEIQRQVEGHREYIREQGMNLKVYSGAEVYLNPELLPLLGVEGSYCLNGGCYILVELPMHQLPNYVEDFWYELRVKGLKPIIAHPERYGALMTRPDLLEKWREDGLLLQCNIGSFAGEFGPCIQAAARDLARQRLVDLVGSDAHWPRNRNTDMRQGLGELEKLITQEDYLRITALNPQKILRDEEIELPEPELLPKKNLPFSWLRRILK